MWRVALALWLLASPALAGRVLVIRQFSKGSSEAENAASRTLSVVTSRLDVLGVDYDVIVQQALGVNGNASNFAQAALRTGTVYYGKGAGAITRQYAAMIHMGFQVNGTRASGYNPDTLTKGASWAGIPHIFIAANSVAASGFSNSAACSTGMSGSATLSPVTSLTCSFNAPGFPYAFKVGAMTSGGGLSSIAYYHNGANSIIRSSTQHGVFRSRLVVGGSAVAFNDNGNSSAQWPDSMYRPTSQTVGADTAVIWTRERADASGNPTGGAPLIFSLLCNVSNAAATHGDSFVDMVVAIADSATGGQVIGQREGWKPPTIAFVVSGAFTRSESGGTSSTHGIHCGTPCDTALVKAGIDSLKTLGIPWTVTVNIDSVASYPYEKAWWAGITTARFAPEPRVGTGADLTGAARLADRYSSPDIFGYRRTRTMGTYDQLAGTAGCTDTDTSLVCMLKFVRFRLDSIPEFHGRVGRFILAPWTDYLHAGITRASTPGEDTLAAALRRAGFTCAGLNTILAYGGMASWWNASGGNQTPLTGAPFAFNVSQHRTRSAFGLDDFNWLAFRGVEEGALGSAYTSHPVETEFYAGTSGTVPWYRSDLPYWLHNFRSKLSLFVVPAGDLGFQASATANPVRPAYHQARWLVSQIRLINAFAGRTVIRIGYPEDIEP